MGRSNLNTLVPLRFLCTIAHLIAAIMVLYQREDNVLSSLGKSYTTTDYESADSSVLAAIWLTIICIMVEILGMFGGFSMFMPTVSAFDIAAHFVGTLLLTWYLMEEWYYSIIWYIFVFFSLIPALLELMAILRIFCCRVEKY